ncbi:MAG TPA: glycosyltransferase family 2 protein [Anaerolineales bacterium]|nr:glycosyltransferase family 2 protein [Anaerolineales bacterium]
MTPQLSLTAIVLTYNEEKHLPGCLASLGWVPHVLVFDSFSTDQTCQIARQSGASVLQKRFENYAAQRNAALKAVDSEWVLFIDADERVLPALQAEILSRVTNNPQEHGFWIPRHNYIFGKLTRHSGWYPDYQLRLMRRVGAEYDSNRQVHELVQLAGETAYLQNPLEHINYERLAEFLKKQRDYTRYDAQILFNEGKRTQPQNYLLQPLRQFIWRFWTLNGWRDGWHGLRLSALMAYFQFVLYRELARLASQHK